MSKSRVLLIDDDLDFLDTMACELENFDYEVFKCAHGDDVKILLQNQDSIDYALIDLRLGSESGLSIIPLIRKRYPHSKIIMLTAFGSIATTVEAMKKGGDNYLMKPCSIEEILSTFGEEQQEDHPASEDFAVPDLYRKEREYIDYILKMNQGNISQAAKVLGIKRQSLQRKLKKFIPKDSH